MAVGVVVNPVAGCGRMGRMWPRIEPVLAARLGPLTVMKTDAARAKPVISHDSLQWTAPSS